MFSCFKAGVDDVATEPRQQPADADMPAPGAATGATAAADHADTLLGAPHTSSPVEAWCNNKLTLGFSGGGFLLPYHVGVYQALAALGIARPTMPMAGASAGSLVVAAIKSGLTVQQQLESFWQAAHDCRTHGVMGRLRAVLKGLLSTWLPPDAHERCSDGTCWLSVTQVLPRPANKLYGAWDSRRALIKALLASCHLPRLSDGWIFTSYKGIHKRCFDGGFSNLCPVPPAPPPPLQAHHMPAHVAGSSSSTTTTTTTTQRADPAATAGVVLPATPLTAAAGLLPRADSTKGISTRLGPLPSHGSSSSVPRRHSHHLRIGSTATTSSSHSSHVPGALAERCQVTGAGSYVAAAAAGWFCVRVCVLPSTGASELPAMLRAPSASELSIAPDKFQVWPAATMEATAALALFPSSDDFLWELFQRGQQDAVSWASQQGFPAAVLRRGTALGGPAAVTAAAAAAAAVSGQEDEQGEGSGLAMAQQPDLPVELRAVKPALAQQQLQQVTAAAEEAERARTVQAAADGARQASKAAQSSSG